MRFSVLIPLYNAECFISECLDSVLSQNFDDYEIVIVDDGSTDGSAEIVDVYQIKHPEKIKVIHKQNEGVLLTRRRALRESAGEYILWVDSDDLVKPNLMATMDAHIIQNSPDLILFDYELMDTQKIIHSLHRENNQVGVNRHSVLSKFVLGRDLNELFTKCIRRGLIDADVDYSSVGHVKMGDDMLCLIPIFDAAKRIEYIRTSFYKYRPVASSITHTTDYRSYFSYRIIYERLTPRLNKWNFSAHEMEQARRVFSVRIIDCIMQCCASVCKDDYDGFVRQTALDEEKFPICLDDKSMIENKVVRAAFELWKAKKFDLLYAYIRLVVGLSNLRHLIQNG